jgi:hypothetical protein
VASAGILLAGTALVACGGDDSAEEFCSLADELESIDPTAADFDADEYQQALEDAVEAAPDDIRENLEIVRDTFEDIDLSDPEATADPELVEKLSDPEFSEAGERINTYLEDNCDSGG